MYRLLILRMPRGDTLRVAYVYPKERAGHIHVVQFPAVLGRRPDGSPERGPAGSNERRLDATNRNELCLCGVNDVHKPSVRSFGNY